MSEKVFDITINVETGVVTEVEVSPEELAKRELDGAEALASIPQSPSFFE